MTKDCQLLLVEVLCLLWYFWQFNWTD